MNRSMMVILAHPDDETFPMGGTLAKAVSEGKQVHLVVATRGEAGIVGRSAEDTAVVREAELRRACVELGIQKLTFLDYLDGTLADIPDRTGQERVLALLRQDQPQVVITFGPDGISGHPDHLAVYRWTTAAFQQYITEQASPAREQVRLYYIAPSEATQQGCGVAPPAADLGGQVAFIDVEAHLMAKVRAAQQHQSQNPPFKDEPEVEAQKMVCHEAFRLAWPPTAVSDPPPLEGLFVTLPRELYEQT